MDTTIYDLSDVCWQQERIDRMKRWQRDIMGNHCTICWNNNGWVQCAACGWWGYVAPQTEASDEPL